MSLKRHSRYAPRGPVVLAILDGIGRGAGDEADAVALARTPNLDHMWTAQNARLLRAHGTAVGLPSDDDMGNSEVGHNALGAGKIHDQGAKLVNRAVADGTLFTSAAWETAMQHAARGGAIHFLGLLSDGNVHSHQNHLFAMLTKAAQQGAKRLFVHALLDGRDVAPTSAPIYVAALETHLAALRSAHAGLVAQIASGGGRMRITMDRYEADWAMVERGWATHVHGQATQVASAQEAIDAARAAQPGIVDQDLPAFVVVNDAKQPVGRIADGDAVIMFNFRGDRAIEITRAFCDETFPAFDRGARPRVFYAGMMQYDGDLHLPAHFLVAPPAIARPMGELLAEAGTTQLAISETQKYGHVTYFWNGNRSGKFDDHTETYIDIPSDVVPFEQRPWMKCAEITDRLLTELRTGRHAFARVNYPNGDMVGHTGNMAATILAVEAVDLALGRLAAAVAQLDGTLVVTADHGNADEMYQRDKAGRVSRDKRTGEPLAKTSHTLNQVPFVVVGNSLPFRVANTAEMSAAGIANVTASCLELLGFEAPDDLEPSLLRTIS